MLFAQVLDQLAHLPDLIWIEADCRLIENEQVGFMRAARPPDRPAVDNLWRGHLISLLLHLLETAKFLYIADTLR